MKETKDYNVSQCLKNAIDPILDPSYLPFFKTNTYKIKGTKARKLLNDVIEYILNTQQIQKQLKYFSKAIYGNSSKEELSSIYFEAKKFLSTKFTKVPNNIYSKAGKFKTIKHKQQGQFDYKVGLYELHFVNLIEIYLRMALNDLQRFPLFGLEHISFLKLIKGGIKGNTLKTQKAIFNEACWNNVPIEYKESKKQIRPLKKIHPLLQEQFINIPSIRIAEQIYMSNRFPSLAICFSPWISNREIILDGELISASIIINNICEALADKSNLPFSIDRIEDLISKQEEFINCYRQSSKQEKEFKSEDEKAKFIIDIFIYTVLKGVKPIIADYRSSDVDSFIREWFPVLIKYIDGFKDKFSPNIDPKRWYPSYFRNPVLFAKNALDTYFSKEINLEQNLDTNKQLHTCKDDSEIYPRNEYFKTDQIAQVLGCDPRTIRKHLNQLTKKGTFSQDEVYRKKTDYRVNTWRVCENSKEKVVSAIKTELEKNYAHQNRRMIKQIRNKLLQQNLSPSDIDKAELQIAKMHPKKLRELLPD